MTARGRCLDDDVTNRRHQGRNMGWLGTLFVGAIVGWTGWGMHNGWRYLANGWLAALIAAVLALMVKMLGNITGLFVDGSALEWLSSVLGAIIAISLFNLWRPHTRG